MVAGVEMLLGVSLDWLFGVEHRIFPHVLGTGEQGCSAGKPDTHSPGSTRAKAPVIVDVVGDGARVGFQVSGT